MMGYATPNIDRIGREGALFTDHYAQPSCTPGRAAFITGQLPIRTGLTTVGLPGYALGIERRDPTLAEVLKPLGYATGQFGKNHLGDRNEHLPTVHGFDEFYGNLYHLNTEEEPELFDCPKDPGSDAYGPRGVLDCVATDVDDPTDDPRFGRVGKQRCKDTGPLTVKRMETVDDEFLDAHRGFIKRAQCSGKPFFAWFNPSRMHIYTHLRPEYRYLPRAHQRRRHLWQRPDGARQAGRRAARDAAHDRKRREHDRRLHDRQRPERARGRTAARRRSAARRPPPGKAACACRCWCAGRGTSRGQVQRHPDAHGPVHDAGRRGRRPGRRGERCGARTRCTSTA